MADEQGRIEPSGAEVQLPNNASVPDIYADGIAIQAGVFGFTIVLTRTAGDPPAAIPVAVVRMSPQLAYALSKQLEGLIRQYRDGIGEFELAKAVRESLGIAEDE